MGNIYDFYFLFTRSLHEPFKTFQTLPPLDVIYKSDEEFSSFHNDQPEPNFHDDVGYPNFNNVGMLHLDNSDESE